VIEDIKYNSEGKLSVNQTIFGDCLEVMKFIQDKSVDFILADLPFG
jgi:DNA modification methylase